MASATAADRVDDRLVGLSRLASEPRVAAPEVLGVECAQDDGGGEEAAAERRIGHEADAELAHGLDRVGLDVAGPQRVLALHRGDRVDRVGAAQQLVVDLGQAQVADLALGTSSAIAPTVSSISAVCGGRCR